MAALRRAAAAVAARAAATEDEGRAALEWRVDAAIAEAIGRIGERAATAGDGASPGTPTQLLHQPIAKF